MKYVALFLSLLIFNTSYAASEDLKACKKALEAIKKYDNKFYSLNEDEMTCKYNARTAAYWNCVKSDLKNGGTSISALGICDKKS